MYKRIALFPLLVSLMGLTPGGIPFDLHFLSRLHQGNQNEIAAGELALAKGQSRAVRSYGERLVLDHRASDLQLMSLAKKERINLESLPLAAVDKEFFDKAHKLTGDNFDRLFRKKMIEDHKKDVAEVRESLNLIENPDIKDFARKLLPKLRQHEQWAMQLPFKAEPKNQG